MQNYDKTHVVNDTTRHYTKNGALHRLDGPARIAGSSKEWYINGVRHRDNDLPAIEFANEYKAWYVNGLSHRDNGMPAVIDMFGELHWYENGIRIDSYYPNFGCVADTIETRQDALERLNRKKRPYSYVLYMADIDKIFPRINCIQ